MKKFKGCGCIGIIILFALCAIAAFTLTRESVQTNYANSLLEEKFPGSSLKRVRVLPGSLEIEGLDLKLDATKTVKLQSLKGEFSTTALFTRSLEISSLSVEGLEAHISEAEENMTANDPNAPKPVDYARKSPPQGKPDETAPEMRNDSKPFELPNWSVSIAEATADMLVVLPDASEITGELLLKSFSSEKIARVKTLDLDFKTKISMNGLEDENLSLRATMVPSNGASSLKLAVERMDKKLVQLSGKIDAGYGQIETQLQVTADSSDVKNILKDAPDFKINLFAQTNFSADFSRVKTNIALKGDAKNLGEFYRQAMGNPNLKFLHTAVAHLEPIEEVSTSSELAAELANSELSIANCDILLTANQSQILRVKNASAFKLDPKNISNIPDGELLEVEIPALPAKIVSAFAGDSMQITGRDISAKFALLKKGDEFLLRTLVPLTVPNLRLAKGESILLSNVSPSLTVSGTYKNESAAVEALLSANPSHGENLELSLRADISKPLCNMSLEISGAPAALVQNVQLPKGMHLQAKISGKCDIEKKTVKADSEIIASSGEDSKLVAEISAVHEAENTAADIKLSGDIASIMDLGTLSEKLTLAANANLVLEKDIISAENLKVRIISPESGDIFTINQLAKISYDTKTARPIFSGKILEAESKNLPFAIFKPFVPGADAQDVSLKVSVGESKGTVSMHGDFAVSKLSFKKDGSLLLKEIDLKADADADADFNLSVLSAKVNSFNVSQANSSLLLGDASARASFKTNSLDLTNVSLSVRGSLAKILSQPALEKFNNVSNGSFEAKAELKGGDLSTGLSLHNVSPKTEPESTGKITADINAKLEGFAPKTISAALKSESQKGLSDISLTADLNDEIIVNIKSENITTHDFELLAKAFSNPLYKDGELRAENTDDGNGKKRILRPSPASVGQTVPKTPEQTAPEKNGKAVWDFGKTLKLALQAQRIQRQSETLAGNINASLLVNSKEVKVSSLSGDIFGAKLDAASTITFNAENIYELSETKATLNGLQVDKFMQPNTAGEKMFIGSFDISAKLFGKNDDLAKLPQTMMGEAAMVSKGGVLHIMDRGSNAGMATEVGSTLLKVGGAVLGNRVKELGAIGDIVGLLSEMNYSNIHAYARRGEDLDIHVTDAEVRADHLLLKTQGVLKYNPEIPLANQAIYFPVKLYAKRGETSDLFSKIGLTTGQYTQEGFADGPTFVIKGTLSKPENNLFEVISNAAANAAVSPQKESGPGTKKQSEPTIGNAIGNILKGIGEKKN